MCLYVFLCSQAARSGALNCCTRNNNARLVRRYTRTVHIIILWSVTCAGIMDLMGIYVSVLSAVAAARCQWMCVIYFSLRWAALVIRFARATFLSVFVFGTNFSSLPILSIHSNKVSSKLMAYSQTGEVLNLEREESSHCCSYAWFKSTQLSIQYRATYELKNINKNVYFSFVYDLKWTSAVKWY